MPNFFDQFDAPSGSGNYFDQFDQTAATPEPKKSFGLSDTWPARLAAEIYKVGKSAATLPGDVYQGRVDPLSEEGIQRSAGAAMLATPVPAATRAGVGFMGVAKTGRLPSTEELGAAATAGYNAPAVKALEVKPEVVPRLSQTIQAELSKESLDDILAPKTFALLSKADKSAPEGATVTAANIESFRRALGHAAGSIDPTERMAATIAKRKLDELYPEIPAGDVLRGNPAEASGVLGEARGNYAGAARSERVGESLQRAEDNAASTGSGANIDNATRQQFKALLRDKSFIRGASPEEVAQVRSIVEGTYTGNAARLLGKFAPTGVHSAALGGSVGYVAGEALGIGGQAGAVGLMAFGFGAKKLAETITRKQVEKLDSLIRSQTPLAKQMKGPLESWNKASEAFQTNPSPRTFGMITMTARNLSNNLKDAGINVPPNDLIRGLQSPVKADTEPEQP